MQLIELLNIKDKDKPYTTNMLLILNRLYYIPYYKVVFNFNIRWSKINHLIRNMNEPI